MDKKKHIICEKPMALSIDDADRMIESAKKTMLNFVWAIKIDLINLYNN